MAPAEASNTCAGYLTVAVLDPTYFSDGYYDETICGGGSVAAPNVNLMTRTNASTAITTATLVVGTQTDICDIHADEIVVGQAPSAGTLVATGSAVNLLVSTGIACAPPPAVNGRDGYGVSVPGVRMGHEGDQRETIDPRPSARARRRGGQRSNVHTDR